MLNMAYGSAEAGKILFTSDFFGDTVWPLRRCGSTGNESGDDRLCSHQSEDAFEEIGKAFREKHPGQVYLTRRFGEPRKTD